MPRHNRWADILPGPEPKEAMPPHSTYTEEAADIICANLSRGITVAETCRQIGVGRTTVYRWRDERPEFAERFAHARDVGFDAIAEEALEIADEASNDWMQRNLGGGPPSYVENGETVQRSKLRIETRLKLLAKWSPKRYGDMIKVGDPSGEAMTVEIVRFGKE